MHFDRCIIQIDEHAAHVVFSLYFILNYVLQSFL